jgi:hypothetical protein
MSKEKAREHLSIGEQLCRDNDILIVGDTTPDGRPVFESLFDGHCPNTTVIIEITNRFDWAIDDPDSLFNFKHDSEKYYQDFEKLSVLPQVKIIANNPFEEYYLKKIRKLKVSTLNVARPLGVATIDFVHEDAESKKLAFKTNNEKFTEYDMLLFEEAGVEYEKLSDHYGGPKALAKYRAFIEIPYQTSTMKLYENLAHGVVMLVPTVRLLKEIYNKVRSKSGIYIFKQYVYVEQFETSSHLEICTQFNRRYILFSF